MTTITLRLSLAAAVLLSIPALADESAAPAAAATQPAVSAAAPKGDSAKGKTVFQQNCMICHGPSGKGDGPAAAGLATRPANYSERHSSEERQIKIVANGGSSEGLSSIMPAWGDTLTEAEIVNVVAYIRTNLSTPDQSAPVATK